MDLNQLIDLSKEGHREAQRALYHKNKNLWYTICLRYIRTPADAQDVLQNALIKIFTKIHMFDKTVGNWTSWTSKIVVNECLQFLRKEKSRATDVDLYFQVKRHITPAKAMSNLSLEDLKNIIVELPSGARTVFNLYVMDGYSHKEIAEMLNISVGSSKSQLSYARKLLKDRIDIESTMVFNMIS